MLAADMRLRRSRDIAAVFKRGTRIRTPYVHVYVLPKSEQATSRAACVVSTRVSRSSVVRHRYQRWLREAASLAMHEAFTGISCDCVWVALPSVTRVQDLAQLKDEIMPLLRQYAAKGVKL